MKTILFLIGITAVCLVLFWTHSLPGLGGDHTVKELLANPREFFDKQVTVTGVVGDTFALMGTGYFQLKDADGSGLAVLSKRGIPAQGRRPASVELFARRSPWVPCRCWCLWKVRSPQGNPRPRQPRSGRKITQPGEPGSRACSPDSFPDRIFPPKLILRTFAALTRRSVMRAACVNACSLARITETSRARPASGAATAN